MIVLTELARNGAVVVASCIVLREGGTMPEQLHLNFNPAVDNCFDQIAATWTDGGALGNLTLRVHNTGTENINVVLEYGFKKYETDWFNPGQSKVLLMPLPNLTGAGAEDCKITRWRPGLLGIPGNGGGEILFGCPFVARTVDIELNVPK